MKDNILHSCCAELRIEVFLRGGHGFWLSPSVVSLSEYDIIFGSLILSDTRGRESL